jgi:hypothetical protein
MPRQASACSTDSTSEYSNLTPRDVRPNSVKMEIATSADHSFEQLILLQEIEEDLRNSHIHGGSAPGPNEPVSQVHVPAVHYNTKVPLTAPVFLKYQTVRQRVTTNYIRQYFVARSTNIYILDNSLVVDGSSNNITIVTDGPHRSN